jgi:hypothetical protein
MSARDAARAPPPTDIQRTSQNCKSGAIVVGKTNTAEFGQTYPVLFCRAENSSVDQSGKGAQQPGNPNIGHSIICQLRVRQKRGCDALLE